MLQFTKRALSAFLALVMVFTMLPLQVWAEEVGSQDSDNSVNLAGLYGGVKAEEKVAARIDLDAASALLPVGQTHTFTPTLYDENGEQMEGAEYVWTSSNTEIATVSGGQVTGVKEGVATITCQYGSLQTEAMVTVTAASYQLTYVIDYPDDAKKFAYNSGVNEGDTQGDTQGAVIITPSNTSITESYAPGTVVTIPDNLATTINYRLTGFADEQGEKYSNGSQITLNSNIKLTSTWEKIVDESTTDKMSTITLRYHSTKQYGGSIDKIVSVMASEPETNGNKQTRTITFMTANIQDTLGLIDKSVKHRDLSGWRINNEVFGFNSQATVTIERKRNWGTWGEWPSSLDVYPVKGEVESGKAVAQFYIRKQSHTGAGPIAKTDYYSVGTGIVDTLPKGMEKIEGDDVQKYIKSAPSLTQIANLMNETIPAGAAIRWYKLEDTDNGYHVDGEIYIKGKYWNVRFVDPDSGKVVHQQLVEDLKTIASENIIDGIGLNTQVREFKWWSFTKDGEKADLTSPVNQDITLYAVFDRYAGYTVKHLFEDLNDNYELRETQTFRAIPGSDTAAEAKSVEGFTAQAFKQKKVAADGKTTVEIKYRRNSHDVIYTITGNAPTGVTAPEKKTYKFGATVTQEAKLGKDGYSFVGWTETDLAEKPPVEIEDGKFIMPDRDVTFTGSFTVNSYDVRYQLEDGSVVPTGFKLPGMVTKNFGEIVGVEAEQEFTGYTFTGWSTTDAEVKNNEFSMPDKPVVFTGSYTINSHKVTYKLTAENESYTGEMPGPTSYKYDADVNVWTPTVADGYEFSGWTVEGAAVGDGQEKFKMPDNDVTLTGTISRKQYTVSYAYGTGSAEPAGYQLPGKSAPYPFGSVVKDLAAPDAQTAEGYTFDGWFTEEECGDGSRVTGDYKMPIGGGTLYGKFTANEYTVTYHLEAPDNVTVEVPKADKHAYTSDVDVESIVAPAGYSFVGWHTKEGSKVVVKDGDKSFKMPAGDVELYGVIEANDNTAYTVVYKFQNADNDGYSVREDVDSKTLYGTTGETTVAPELAGGDVPNGFKYKETKNVPITGDRKAVAEVYYDRKIYTISWTVDGTNGQAVEKEETLRFEETIGNKGTYPADPTPNAGYKFAGWNMKREELPDTMPAENIVITGTYAPIDYTVEYVAVGAPEGTTLPQPEGFYHVGNDVKLMGEPMSPAGYKFEGWYKDEACTDKATDFEMPAHDVTIYGKFSKRTDLSYTVKYLWNNTETEVAKSSTVHGQTFGDIVTVRVPTVEGYTPVSNEAKSITITAGDNVVEFHYYKNVTLKANSDNNRIYNGETQTAKPGYESSEKNAVFEGIVPTGSGKDAKEYPIAFPANTLNTIDKTKLYIVTEVKDGKLTINPKAVTLRTESASKDYDGTALTIPGVVGTDGFVTGEVTTVRATGTQTLVGESKNTIEIVWADDALAKNYTITEDLGTLTVTAPETFDYVQKDANNEKFAIGEKVTFTITVTNIYDVPATVVLEEQVGMTFEGGETKLTTEIPAGETRAFTVSYVVTKADVEAGQIANKVTWTLTPNGTDVTVEGNDESTIENESYLVWYVLEGDRGGCTNLDSVTVQKNHKYGTLVEVWMPVLSEGYKFSGWTVEGAVIENGVFSMPENAVILTGTISKEQVKVDYKAQEGGLITDSNGLSYADLAEMVPYGEDAKGATASAKKGYTFVEWQDANHKQVSTDPEFIPTNVTAPATYYAVFAKQKVKVEYTADVGGFITSPSGATFGSVIEQVTYGENAVGATASAKPGYYFVHWLDAEGNEVGTELHFAPENVTEEAVYKAVFAEQTAIEVKAEDLRKEYDGTAIEANDKYTTNTTLKDGHKLVVTTKVSKDVINVTDTDGKHQIESIKILDANDKDVTGQYQVRKADGSLTILPKPISIEVADGVKTYGETELEITVTANGLVNGNDLGEITYERGSESENAGVYTDDLWPVYTPNPNYTVTEMPGTLTINKRPIVLTSYGDTKTYDGEALTKPEVEIGDVKFVDGHVEKVEAIGTQTLVGESKNAIEITWADKTVEGNYEIIKTEGTLTVTAPEKLDEYVVKTHEGQNFKVGDTVTFKITVTNIYAVKATVKLEEMAGMTFGNGQTALEDVLEPGETKTYTATRLLTEQDFENDGVSNRVEVTLDPDGEEPEIHGTDTDEVPLKSKPDMSVVKTVLEPKESYRVGDTIRYQITVTNTGNVPLHDLELTDVMNADGKVTFPAGTDLTRETLNVGGSWSVTCSYVVRDADEGKTLSNTAKVITHKPGKDEPVVDKEDRTDGEPVEKRYSLTIHYRNAAGNAVAGSYSARYHVGDSFKIDSPIVAGYYDPQIRSISSGANGMPAQDLEYVVIYTAIPAPVDPDPEGPNPGPNVPDDDDDDDDTPPVPDPEQEQPPQPQDFEIDPDDYTLTEVEDNETPLANLNLEGHTCCILHLLLMLAAMVVLGFDTKSRKKHQARIFELKKMLAMEEDHSDDPEQP